MNNKDVNWYAVKSAAVTAIRVNMSVLTLQELEADGNETAVSGDALAQTFEHSKKLNLRNDQG